MALERMWPWREKRRDFEETFDSEVLQLVGEAQDEKQVIRQVGEARSAKQRLGRGSKGRPFAAVAEAD